MDILKILDWSRGKQGKRPMQESIDSWCNKYATLHPDIVAEAIGFFCMCGTSP